MLISPQEYFENPHHFSFEDYFLITQDDMDSGAIYDIIENDFKVSFEKEYNLNMSGDDFSSENFDKYFDYRDIKKPFSYFMINWNYIYKAFDSNEDLDDKYLSLTKNYLAELISFFDHFKKIEIEDNVIGKVVIVKFKNELRNIKSGEINEIELKKHKSIFSNYENFETYEDF